METWNKADDIKEVNRNCLCSYHYFEFEMKLFERKKKISRARGSAGCVTQVPSNIFFRILQPYELIEPLKHQNGFSGRKLLISGGNVTQVDVYTIKTS